LAVFRKWPSSTSAARLHKTAGKAWPGYRDEVVTTLAASPSDAVLFALHTLKEPEFAWNLAHSFALDNGSTWSELVKAYEKVDPIATLPIHQRLVEGILIEANAKNYKLAARRLATMRKLSAGSEKSAEVDNLIAELREVHRVVRACSRSSTAPDFPEKCQSPSVRGDLPRVTLTWGGSGSFGSLVDSASSVALASSSRSPTRSISFIQALTSATASSRDRPTPPEVAARAKSSAQCG